MTNTNDKAEPPKIPEAIEGEVLDVGQTINDGSEHPKISNAADDNSVRTTHGRVCDISDSKRWRGLHNRDGND